MMMIPRAMIVMVVVKFIWWSCDRVRCWKGERETKMNIIDNSIQSNFPIISIQVFFHSFYVGN